MEMIGREDELQAVEAILDGATSDEPFALVLEGEAGLGKSTLWHAALAAARTRGFRVLSARPAEVEAGILYAGLTDLLEEVVEDVAAELPGARLRALEGALLLGDHAGEPAEFRTLAVAVRSVLELVARGGPVLVAVDDVQWLDASSATALVFALRRLQGAPVSVLLARRLEDGVPASPLETAVQERTTHRLRLRPLSRGALHRMLNRRLDRAFSRPVLLRIHDASGGNPFYALELARALPADVDPTEPLPVPPTLEALVSARLSALPARTRSALLLACVQGSLPETELENPALEPAYADRLIALDDGGIRFTHPLLASTLYQDASPAARRQAHARAAVTTDDAVGRARHRALSTAAADEDVAAELEAAVEIARGRGDPVATAELAEFALRQTPADASDDVHRRSLLAARAQGAAGELERAEALASAAVQRAPAGVQRAESLAALAEVAGVQRAVPLLEEAIDHAAAAPRLRAALYGRLARVGRMTRGRQWAERHTTTAAELAERAGDDALRAGALATLALIRFDQGDPGARADVESAHELALRTGDDERILQVTYVLAHVLCWSVAFDDGRRLLEEVTRDWGERDENAAASASWYLALLEWRAGRWDDALRYAEAVYGNAVEYGNLAPHETFPLGLICAHRGDFERATELATLGRSLADAQEGFFAGIRAIQGVVDLWRGDPRAAVEWFARAEDFADTAGWVEPNMRWWRPEHVEALLELGRTAEATALLDPWEEAASRVGREWALAQALRCRGLVLAAAGDVAAAAAALEEAAERHSAVGDPFGRARALFALGAARRRARRKRPAREAFQDALEGFERLGAASWAERTQEELGHIGGQTAIAGLSPAERRVAVLVAEGRTNREVAAALFLGERTVASHLTRVYAKLGVRSRAELAAKVHTF